MSTERVIVSTNNVRCYAWYAPLTCLAWKHVTGTLPTVICVGDGIDPVILAKIEEAGGDIIAIPDMPGYDAAGVAQLCRLYAFAERKCRDDYLMTTDIDAWPLAPHPFIPSGKAIDIYMTAWPVLPMGYIGAEAVVWRSFMKASGDTLVDAMRSDLQTIELGASKGFNADEGLVTRKIGDWLYPEKRGDVFGVVGRMQRDNRVRVVIRPGNEYATDRVWFNHWPEPPIGMTDAHLCSRNSHPTWAQLYGLLVHAGLPSAALAWARKYHDEVPSW